VGRMLRVLAILSAVLLYMTIVIGALVNAFNAGLACGTDWPTCNGYLIPPDILEDAGVFLEYTHRLVGGLASLFVMLSFMYSLSSRKQRIVGLAGLTLSLVIVQVVLGMAVIRSYLDEMIIALHLSFATASVVTASILAYSTGKC